MVKTKKRLKGIDLFAGAGGFSLGMQQAGIDIVAAVEKDQWCCDTLRANHRSFPKMQVIQEDIIKLKGGALLAKVHLKKGELDMLVGGPPCQGFSFINSKRSENDPHSMLMWQFVRMVREIQPRYFCIENVRGLLSFKEFFIDLLSHLETCGYIVRFNLLDAASYGVPQHRERVLIDGSRKDLNILPVFPPPTHFDPESLKGKKNSLPASLVAIKCFASNGFSNEEVYDVWFNPKLKILMNRKTAATQIEQAAREIIFEALASHIKRKKCG
jgi:DNA (cytosine-5)-methyltransferase 1